VIVLGEIVLVTLNLLLCYRDCRDNSTTLVIMERMQEYDSRTFDMREVTSRCVT
jgi:hypothetical protein